MKRKQQSTPRLLLKKTAIAALDSASIKGGATFAGCVQPTTTVQHTYICPSVRMVCPTTETLHCTTE
ncbi:hypothetical protein [Taibaiella helva]|uniref:hypothetical protein n=1 Tax=Taibaiella helva TaxID=2301235 RepID=UPI000E57AD12|nr:hypothetical protein [Taibaiella helva]